MRLARAGTEARRRERPAEVAMRRGSWFRCGGAPVKGARSFDCARVSLLGKRKLPASPPLRMTGLFIIFARVSRLRSSTRPARRRARALPLTLRATFRGSPDNLLSGCAQRTRSSPGRAHPFGGFLCLDRSFGRGTRTTSCPGYPTLIASSIAVAVINEPRARRSRATAAARGHKKKDGRWPVLFRCDLRVR
jgi:hypothetical protein